jgi:hypothetical protein
MTIRYAQFNVPEADNRTCEHHERPVDCDCDTIAAELADQD